ncbi:BON domain-containing protein [Rhizobium tubonense]|uniref:BON domain-containing protein n=1 Tax=Rhizobium tubonense TaxID=484088 RepID=A0A2W4C8S7_9HYPH|nr:BON domain-containing protein [Rhizobium tubonense]PZM09839.1 BON domain-containing protein [Rhizobium tubonense]
MVMKTATFHGDEPEVETEYSTRASLEAAVANALATSGGVDAWDVKVRSVGEEILLDGSVGTAEELERATTVAQSVEGVGTVRNHIVLGQRGKG